MKVEILEASHSAFYPNIWIDNKKIAAPKKSIRDPFGWSEDEILCLLGESKYKQYEQGIYEFNVSASHVKLITGQRAAKDNHELKLLVEYGIL